MTAAQIPLWDRYADVTPSLDCLRVRDVLREEGPLGLPGLAARVGVRESTLLVILGGMPDVVVKHQPDGCPMAGLRVSP